MEKIKIAIIGGGTAGLIAASVAKTQHTIVELYEKNARIGKKILASGNGRCNISNTNITKEDYYGEDVSFVEAVMKRFGFKELDRFCKNIGLLLEIKEDGRVYPVSNEAKSVVTAFEANLKRLKVKIFTNTPVCDIEKIGQKFKVFSNDGLLGKYDRVLITTGLLAAPNLGGSDEGIRTASKFGHSYNTPYPALVPLELEGSLFKKMNGVRYRAAVSLYVDKKSIKEVLGDVLFTRYGISGFAVLDISIEASYYLSRGCRVEVSINFFPQFDKGYISRYLEKTSKNLEGYTVLDILGGILPHKSAKALLKKQSVDMNLDISLLGVKQIKAFVSELFNLKFTVKSTRGFEYAEVCGGGIKTNEVNRGTMESKLVKGLYFAGEVLDIVGKRGGYNLAFSFASGYAAGRSLSVEKS